LYLIPSLTTLVKLMTVLAFSLWSFYDSFTKETATCMTDTESVASCRSETGGGWQVGVSRLPGLVSHTRPWEQRPPPCLRHRCTVRAVRTDVDTSQGAGNIRDLMTRTLQSCSSLTHLCHNFHNNLSKYICSFLIQFASGI